MSQNKGCNVAVFIDMENASGVDFDFKKLMKHLLKSNNIRVKKAYGNQQVKKSLKTALCDYNFDIKSTYKVAKLKNRADLQISLDVFEEMVLIGVPKIDKCYFISSDVDFTVVSDKLRKHSIETAIIGKKEVLNKPIFLNSFDEVIPIENF